MNSRTINTIFNHEDIIIECSNKTFFINRSDIEIYKNSLLYKIITQEYVDTKHYPLHNNRHIIKLNRDPKLFSLIAEFYRKHKVYVPYNIPYEQIYDEFDYFCLPFETLLRPLDLNSLWKLSNKNIIITEAIINMYINSKIFKWNMQNSLSFCWYIGGGYCSEKDYTKSYNIIENEKLRIYITSYLKNKFNLKTYWSITEFSLNKNGNKKIHYFYPEIVTNSKEVEEVVNIETICASLDCSYIQIHTLNFECV